MLSKNRTILLLVVLAIVVGIYLIMNYTQDKERNFRTRLVDFDTAVVNRIEISPPSPAGKMVLLKKAGSWKAIESENEYSADNGSVRNLMMQLDGSKVINVAANSPSDWEKYKTTDLQGTRVQFMNNSDILSDIFLGKFDYIQPKNQQQQNPYMQQPQGEMLSYARISGEDAVYTIDGMISLGLGKTADDYRDKRLTNLDFVNIEEISFSYADGTTFKIFKEMDKWLADHIAIDSATTVSYLKSIVNLRGREFFNDFVPDKDIFAKVTISQTASDPIELKAYAMDTASFVLASSANPTNLILDTDKKITEKLFVRKDHFITK